jgi:hypothetical protein
MNESITAIEKRAVDAHAEASAIVIRDQDGLTLANTKTIAIKALIKEIDDCFKPIHDAQKEAASLTKATWDKYRVPLDGDYRRIKADIGVFLIEQDRLKKEAEHRVWQAEQEKIKAEAEAKRIAEEAMRKAAIAEAKGDTEKADKILEKAAVQETKMAEKIETASVAASVPIPARAQTFGISTREDWDIELIDISQVPREYLMFDEVKARKVVRASKGAVQITGVKNIKKTIVSQR